MSLSAILMAALSAAALAIGILWRGLTRANTRADEAERSAEEATQHREEVARQRDAAEAAHRTATRDGDGVLERANRRTEGRP